MQLQNNIKLDDLEYRVKREKRYNFSKYSIPIVFQRDIHEGNVSLEDADEEQSQFVNELKDMGKGKIPVLKKICFKECRIISSCKRKTFLITLKIKYFQQKI